jgi:hypothetical protein
MSASISTLLAIVGGGVAKVLVPGSLAVAALTLVIPGKRTKLLGAPKTSTFAVRFADGFDDQRDERSDVTEPITEPIANEQQLAEVDRTSTEQTAGSSEPAVEPTREFEGSVSQVSPDLQTASPLPEPTPAPELETVSEILHPETVEEDTFEESDLPPEGDEHTIISFETSPITHQNGALASRVLEEEEEEDEETYFGTQPLSESQRAAALARLGEYQGDDQQIHATAQGASEGVTGDSSSSAEQLEHAVPQTSRTEHPPALEVNVDQVLATFIEMGDLDAATTLIAAFASMDSALRLPVLRALSAGKLLQAVPVFVHAIQDDASADEVWTAIDGLEALGELAPIEQVLYHEPPLPAKAALAILGKASREDYAAYLGARVSASRANEILETLDPMWVFS